MTALEELRPEDLRKTMTIRGESPSVPLAVHQSLAHCGDHVGQTVMPARVLSGETWTTRTIPQGASKSCNGTSREARNGSA